jgi:hypothetical protein
MSSLFKPPLIWLSSDDVCSEEAFLGWLKSYRHPDRARIRENPQLDSALASHFPEGRYNEGLTVFLSAFRGLLPVPAQRPNVILFKVCTLPVQPID